MDQKGHIRLFEVATPTADDLARAGELALSVCPRRYCWWWQSLSFDWDTPLAVGCRLKESAKPLGFRFPDVPCCRLDPTSGIDQHEPREPHLVEDGFAPARFLGGVQTGTGELPA